MRIWRLCNKYLLNIIFVFTDDTRMEFGGMVSTSNTFSGNPKVTVTTNEAIIWSMGIEPFTKSHGNSANGS